ncbi:hypothetical protein C475_17848 [Halosimplex carlsbadense 2-9-1]|uniref:Uncharacterized protein n=1 Tax=Halosimplex carlsbadense 2-9-1 TaxID=797114 RepID=M0CGJ3_9EURY|nr:hypothetical protein [Halosimplex carlsbadense]ELZ22400.1 hypothetical protein C475_17848 [Halosimplex carlsbadense 2-9-1]
MNVGLIGSETPIDDLIAEYFGEGPNSLLYEVAEDEGTALLACMLMEMRGQRGEEADAEAAYYSETDVSVSTTDEKSIAWDYSASSVLIYGFDAPITVAFKPRKRADRDIPLTSAEAPFSVAPPGGLGASELYYRKTSESASNTSFNMVAFE